ncbi:MAG: S46 family peptidase [Rhabdochlamydiaceae bacterium]
MKRIWLGLFLCVCCCVGAEEGMWPFNMLPVEKIEQEYGVKLSPDWAQHVQQACVRISLGGSGSFVSSQGLIMTNHHVGSKAIYNLSTEETDLMEKGFLAKSFEQELKCPNMYVESLISIQDITKDVNKDVKDGMTAAEKEKIHKQACADIANSAKEKTGLQPEVVTLYQGAKYHLYLYKRFTDVRLVMAPEKNIAFFGGDADNFEYPRYNLDVCFFRVYENDQPVHPEHYLKWSASGPKALEPLFVAGHPGRTERMLTADHVQFFQQEELPLLLSFLKEKIVSLKKFSSESPENKRIALDPLFSYENAFKVYNGIEKALKAAPIIAEKRKKEQALYGDVASERYLPWAKLKTALADFKGDQISYVMLEGYGAQYCKLYTWAKHLVRLEKERGKPSGERLKEYADHQLAALELRLFSTEPVYKNLELMLLTNNLNNLLLKLGKEHPAVVLAMGGKTPAKRAEELLASTQLTDLEYRQKLYNNPEEVNQATDGFILLAKALDPYARAVREKREDLLESVQKESYAAIAQMLFDRYGESLYPDATFTLRLSIGSLKGYEEKGVFINPMTTLGGVFKCAEKHQSKTPYELPLSWKVRGPLLASGSAFNFVSTNDIIGGNSGSPVINAQGEVVGLIFDGNIHSLIWDYAFEDKQGRAISVHTQGIMEALDKIYQADALVKEIRVSKK